MVIFHFFLFLFFFCSLHEHIIIWLWFSGHGISAIRYATKHGLKKVVENLDATGVNVLAPYAVDQG